MEEDLGRETEVLPRILIKPHCLCFTPALPILIFHPVRIPEGLMYLSDSFHFQLEVFCASFCDNQYRYLKKSKDSKIKLTFLVNIISLVSFLFWLVIQICQITAIFLS